MALSVEVRILEGLRRMKSCCELGGFAEDWFRAYETFADFLLSNIIAGGATADDIVWFYTYYRTIQNASGASFSFKCQNETFTLNNGAVYAFLLGEYQLLSQQVEAAGLAQSLFPQVALSLYLTNGVAEVFSPGI